MDYQELFSGLKGDDQELLDKLDSLKRDLSLTKLYLIYITEIEAKWRIAWGVRPLVDQQKTEKIKAKLCKFIKENTNLDFAIGQVGVLSDPLKEVENVLGAQVIPYIKSHGGELNILGVDEENGIVLVELGGVCSSSRSSLVITINNGIRWTLKSLLYWVRKVEQPGSLGEKEN